MEEIKRQTEARLRELELEMNAVLAEMDGLDESELQYEDIKNCMGKEEKENVSDSQEYSDVGSEDEINTFLGANPVDQTPEDLILRQNIMSRIKGWMKAGLNSKEDKEKLLASIPRKGQLNLIAPALNEEIATDIHPRTLAKDNHFREYQDMAGAALSGVAIVLDLILNDIEVPLERDTILINLSNSVKLLSDLFGSLTQARKSFLLGRYEEKIQKILKNAEPTEWLFGDNLKVLIENSKAIEKASKDMGAGPSTSKTPFRSKGLNWRSPTAKKEVGRQGYRPRNYKTSKYGQSSYKSHPSKRHYEQTQPQQRKRPR